MHNNEPDETTLSKVKKPVTFTHLDYFGMLLVTGQDAAKFLQGQLTCDVLNIPLHGIFGAHCNPQGRIIFLLHLNIQDGNYYLLMPRNMVTVALAALKKYAIFFRVTLQDISEQYTYIGINGIEPQKLNLQETILFNLYESLPRYIIASNASVPLSTRDCLGNSSDWRLQNILHGFPEVYPETSAKFLPQELNLINFKGVNFAKGCYTGQEIIARLHYLGKTKTGLHHGVVTLNHNLPPGTEIYVNKLHERTIVGHIVESAIVASGHYLLMVLAQHCLNEIIYIKLEQKHPISLLTHSTNEITE